MTADEQLVARYLLTEAHRRTKCRFSYPLIGVGNGQLAPIEFVLRGSAGRTADEHALHAVAVMKGSVAELIERAREYFETKAKQSK